MDYIFAGEVFTLLGEKALWHKSAKILLVSDVHVDKVHHFRKNGIPLPFQSKNKSLESLTLLVEKYRPKILVFLGDLFHSSTNEGTASFLLWRQQLGDIETILVRGNHDLIDSKTLLQSDIKDVDTYNIGNIVCSHLPLETKTDDIYNICGHIHPAVRLTGKARQSITLPCFAFNKNTGILPAFGYFTGFHIIKNPQLFDIFCISNMDVIKVNNE
ncbi:MAG: ligase-associated DNA damage response endonuclease PdeM [Saprospiraceae bacterium]